jgi:membrane protease YdiL (CAAX protease family)
MWIPAFAAISSKLFYDHTVKGIGWRVKGFRYIGFAYILPLIACLLVYCFTWITGLGDLEITSVVSIMILSTFGVFISMISAVGEEIGWRGFLLTELRKKWNLNNINDSSSFEKFNKINLVMGLIWFAYHVPIIVFSDYNNGNIITSVICFFLMVMAITVIANELCIRARNMWPAVMLHASHNLFVQSIFDKITVNGTYTRYVTSEFGIGLAIAYGVVAGIILYKKRKDTFGL